MNSVSSNDAKNILCLVTGALALILAALHFARYKKGPKQLLRKIEWLRTFYVWLGALAILGGAWAFLFPLAITADFGKDGDGAALRQMLIYTTGGVLGVITLGENHRKNSLEKAKNDQDHIRQVHAERRSRYTTAVEQLSSDKASIRLGGVYTLVGLVDEWLSDEKTTSSPEERHKEGQVIINNLCAYIRSPLPLAERAEQLDKDYAKDLQNDFDGDIEKFDADKRAFARDKAALEEERQVRQSIIEEICERLQDFDEPGPWSSFDYDFSNALFFYDTDFRNSYFDALSKFTGAKFTKKVGLLGTNFTERAPFSGATFAEGAKFIEANFTERAPFSGATFNQGALFSYATFEQDADFSKAKFTGNANFSWAKFTGNANFSWAKFTEDTDFSGVEFTGDADFSWAKFTGNADFSKAKFTGNANFSWAKFTDAHFFEAEFTGSADFSMAEFTGSADFSGATFEEKPIFERALGDKTYKARFSYKAKPENYNFKVSHNSRYKIETEEKEYNETKFIIPKGAELFDPDEPSEQGNKKGKNKGVTVQNFITQSHGSNHFDGGNNAVKDSFTNDKKKKSKAAYWTIYSLITLGITVFGGIIVWSMTQHHDSKPDNTVSQPVASASTSTGTTQSPQVTVSPSPSPSYTLSPSSTYSGEASSTTSLNSPVPATRPEGSPPGRISVEFDDAPSSGEKIGRDKYQISSSGHVGLRVGWSSISYNNTVSSNDCEVVLTSSGPAPVKGEIRTAKCTDTYGTSLEFSEPGEYTISVEDKQSGNTGSRVIQIVK